MSFLLVGGGRGGHNADVAKEIEVKYRLGHPRAFRQVLRRAGATFLGSAVIRDDYFDTRELSLLAGDSGLRLRRRRTLRPGPGVAAGEGGGQLTYKGPADRRSRVKIRREIQTGVEDPAALAQLLEALGFVPMVRIEKRRSSFRLGPCSVEVDELPLLGWFAEIEGPSPRALAQAAAKLGLTGPGLRNHYVGLLCERCKRISRSCRKVTPARCRVCPRRPAKAGKSEIRSTKS